MGLDRTEMLALGGLGAMVLAGRAEGDPEEADGPDEYANELVLGKRDDGWASYPRVGIHVATTSRLSVSGRDFEPDEYGYEDGFGWVSTYLEPGDRITVRYDGELQDMSWSGGPIYTRFDGERVDPYILAGDGGPRVRWTGGSGPVVEATIYQSAALFNRHGFVPAETAATYIGGALEEHGISHDIAYQLPAIKLPTEAPGAANPFRDDDKCPRDSSCDSWDCCSIEDSLPSAYWWWGDLLHGGDLSQRYYDQMGVSRTARGDAYVTRKDSNLLLTDAERGGAGGVTGERGTVAARHINERRSYSPDGERSKFMKHLTNVMHEFGHNMGFTHGPNCNRQGGIGWVDKNGYWNATPCVNPRCDRNSCGTKIGHVENATRTGVVRHPLFTPCTADIIRDHIVSTQGKQIHESDVHTDFI